ncbi:MAG TPA: hypothetical protein VJN96_09895 [Vicinamibacterales bacterium]|nr:hypothetical protein [Vicinamibacterales bacterium]
MNIARVIVAALGAFIAYFALGGLFFTNPAMRAEFMKYTAVYRSQEAMKGVMPLGMLGMLISMLALAVIFAMIHPTGAGLSAGGEYGLLIAAYALGSFVLHNHVNLNIGSRLTLFQAVAYSIEWVVVGVVISAIYRG